jgi:hypothetical protein
MKPIPINFIVNLMIMPISNGIFLKEQNIFKKILYYFPYYFFHKNYVFGCYFKFVTKDFIITFNKKKLVFKIPDNRFAISDLCCFFTKTYELNDAWLVKKYLKNDDYPIIIGGGHNNAYGNIKGTALGFGKPINAVNFDDTLNDFLCVF